MLSMKRPIAYRVAQALSATVWAILGILLLRYAFARTLSWLDPRMVSVMIISPVFGFIVSSSHYRIRRRDFLLFQLIVYPLIREWSVIVLLRLAVPTGLGGICVFWAGTDQWA